MRRRQFLLGTLIAGVSTRLRAQAADTVQLLVLRESKKTVACGQARYIKGNLYGVPSNQDLSTITLPVGLPHIAHTEELPYADNAENASCIDEGTYRAKVVTQPTKPWMTNENRAWRLELIGTKPARSAIQFHYGKDYHWSTGCVVLTGTDDLMCKEGRDSPEEAVAALRNYVTIGHNSATPIFVRIAFVG